MNTKQKDIIVIRTMDVVNTSADNWSINLSWSKTEDGKVVVCPLISGSLHFYVKARSRKKAINQINTVMTTKQEDMIVIRSMSIEDVSTDISAIKFDWSNTEDGNIMVRPLLSGSLHFYVKGDSLEEVIHQIKKGISSEISELTNHPIVELIQKSQQEFAHIGLAHSIENEELQYVETLSTNSGGPMRTNEPIESKQITNIKIMASCDGQSIFCPVNIEDLNLRFNVNPEIFYSGSSVEICKFIDFKTR